MTTTNVEVQCKDAVKTKSKPDAILDYNLNKSGVDRNGQMISYYPMKRKQLKWWKKLFFHMFLMAIVNAYILYRETRNENQRNNCHLAFFLQKVGEGFAEKGTALAQNDVSQAVSGNSLLGTHFADRIPPADKKAHPTSVCKICSEKSKNSTGKRERKETVWWCPDCKVPLCMPECFKLYHTKLNYLQI